MISNNNFQYQFSIHQRFVDSRDKLFFRDNKFDQIFRHERRLKILFRANQQFITRYFSSFYSKNRYFHSIENNSSSKRERIFRSQNIMMFDFNKISMKFFIKKFQQIVAIEKTKSILRILFLCMKTNALKWHNELSSNIQQNMNQNLTIWKNEFFKKYRFNRFESMQKTQKIIFRFDKKFIFDQYLTRKINCFKNVEINNEILLIFYLWKNFDVQLTLTIFFKKNLNTIDNFNRKMKNNENAIKKIHEFNKKSTIRSTTSSIRDIANKSIYVFIANRVQRFFNNFQKTTSIVIITSTIIESIKKLFLIEKINVRTYRFLKNFVVIAMKIIWIFFVQFWKKQ